MKVLMISPDFTPNPGGIAVFLHHLCLQLTRLGHRVDILTPAREGDGETDARQPYRVYRYKCHRQFSSIVPIGRTLVLHYIHCYDVVFLGTFMTTHGLGAWFLCNLRGVPYVILCHGNDLGYAIRAGIDVPVARLLLRDAALVLGNSRFTAGRIRDVGYTGSVEVLNPGVDLARFHTRVETTKVRQQLRLDNRRVLLTTARLTRRKNVDTVLHALPRVIAQVPELVYLIVGDGEEKDRLERLTATLELEAHVRFLGHVENDVLSPLYNVAEVFILPSFQCSDGKDYEGFGIALAEASACGLPAIAGLAGGSPEAVIEGETGLLVDPHDKDAIAKVIIRLMHNKKLARQLGQAGRKRIERELDWESVGQRLEGYLESIAKGR